MPAYLKKTTSEILSQALQKIQNDTNITFVGPGSVARALAEAITGEIADLYDLMDFNTSQTVISTATGSALDMLGKLYDTPRKLISDVAAVDKRMGSFIFFLSVPHSADITIPEGTNVYTDKTTYMGRRFSFTTTDAVTIPRGRTRAYASIKPNFIDSVYTAGANTLTLNDFVSPANATVYCTNPKPIASSNMYETDEQYRVRLIKSIRVAVGGTMEAVRFAALNISGVRDVKIRQAPYGLGSFEAIIIPERNETTTAVMNAASEAMTNRKALGVRMFVKPPVYVPLDLTLDIISPGAVMFQTREEVVRRASVAIARYITNLLPGGELVYNQLMQLIMDSSELISDVNVRNIRVKGQEILRRNYRPADDEQIIQGQISVTIAAS